MSDEMVWAAARAGDPSAFGAVFDRHRDRVFGQALRHLRSSHDAEDVTAMVFLEAWRRRESVRVVKGSIVAWLLVTTNNVVLNLGRSRRRHRAALTRLAALEGVAADDQMADVGERLDLVTRDERVRDAFSLLSPADQNIVTLCVLEGMTTAEAADALAIPAGTVKSRLSRAKQRLAALTTTALTEPTSVLGGSE